MERKSFRTLLSSLGAIVIIFGSWFLYGNRDKADDDVGSKTGSDDKVSTADAPVSKLTVMANRCRGCGKCVRADSEHFALDVENRVAIVISTENLDSQNLASAVQACHEDAIVIS